MLLAAGWGGAACFGVSENMDVFIKRHMDVLAASPEACRTSPTCCGLTRNHFSERTLLACVSHTPGNGINRAQQGT